MTLRSCPLERCLYFTMRFPIAIYDNAAFLGLTFYETTRARRRARSRDRVAARRTNYTDRRDPRPRRVKYLARHVV